MRLQLIDGVAGVTLQSSTKSDTGGGSTSGGCPNADPAFAAQVTFQPLPSPLALTPGCSRSPASTAGAQPVGGPTTLSSSYTARGSAR